MRAMDAPLQHDHVAEVEMVTSRMNARPGGGNIQSADVRGASGRDEINFQGNRYRTPFAFPQLAKILQL